MQGRVFGRRSCWRRDLGREMPGLLTRANSYYGRGDHPRHQPRGMPRDLVRPLRAHEGRRVPRVRWGTELLDIERDPTIVVDHRKRLSCTKYPGVVMMRHFWSVKRRVTVDFAPLRPSHSP